MSPSILVPVEGAAAVLSSKLLITLAEPGETIPGTYPMALARQQTSGFRPNHTGSCPTSGVVVGSAGSTTDLNMGFLPLADTCILLGFEVMVETDAATVISFSLGNATTALMSLARFAMAANTQQLVARDFPHPFYLIDFLNAGDLVHAYGRTTAVGAVGATFNYLLHFQTP